MHPARRVKDGCFPQLIDISENKEIIDVVNAILNNKGIAEIKNEKRAGQDNIVVVQISREVKTKKPKP